MHLLQEVKYFTEEGEYRIDGRASKTMLNSMMYKMCYYRFGEVTVSKALIIIIAFKFKSLKSF